MNLHNTLHHWMMCVIPEISEWKFCCYRCSLCYWPSTPATTSLPTATSLMPWTYLCAHICSVWLRFSATSTTRATSAGRARSHSVQRGNNIPHFDVSLWEHLLYEAKILRTLSVCLSSTSQEFSWNSVSALSKGKSQFSFLSCLHTF